MSIHHMEYDDLVAVVRAASRWGVAMAAARVAQEMRLPACDLERLAAERIKATESLLRTIAILVPAEDLMDFIGEVDSLVAGVPGPWRDGVEAPLWEGGRE